jgi:arylsulfatase B
MLALSVGMIASAGPLHAVVFLIDDLGYGDTHHRGAEYPTAHIDELATGGIILNQSYVMQLCSPTRAALLSSRYSYNTGMDGNVLTGGDARCLNTSVATLGDRLQAAGVRTAFIGKYDVGYSQWACTANCRGFEYWLGYYGASEDYYQHGGGKTLDFHEDYAQAPQYRGEYSTELFVRKGIEWVANVTSGGAAATATDAAAAVATADNQSTLLYLSFQAVHGPIELPPSNYTAACGHIAEPTRRTYCAMMQSLDDGVGNITAAYKRMGIFDDTVFLFLADNGGTMDDGGFNVPLRGSKATMWEGGVRSQTFLHWSGFDAARRGSEYGGMAHATDWGVTLQAALGLPPPTPRAGEPALDGINLWPALVGGGPSPRTEMLLSLRDAGECAAPFQDSCRYPGQLAYRRGPYKLIYGHTALRGHTDDCTWSTNPKTGAGSLNCWNGWGVPKDRGEPRPPPAMAPRPGQPANSSLYAWGATLLFDIEADPLEEHDLSADKPDVVTALTAALQAFVDQHISQDVYPDKGATTTEPCGDGLSCDVPWLPYAPGKRCEAAPPSPAPASPTPAPPTPPAPPSPPTPPVPGTNCCQCLKEGGSNACGPPFCDKHGGACKRCVDGGGGASCRPGCGCK